MSELIPSKVMRAIREFAIKIHPDRFMNHSEAFICNTKAFSTLHSLFLQPESPIFIKNNVNIGLKFYLNQADQKDPTLFDHQLHIAGPPLDSRSLYSFCELFRLAKVPFEDSLCDAATVLPNGQKNARNNFLNRLQAESFTCTRKLSQRELYTVIQFLKRHPSISISESVHSQEMIYVLGLIYRSISQLLAIKHHLGHLPTIFFDQHIDVDIVSDGYNRCLRAPTYLSEKGIFVYGGIGLIILDFASILNRFLGTQQ